jgi:hypothetical protein
VGNDPQLVLASVLVCVYGGCGGGGECGGGDGHGGYEMDWK